MINAIEDAFGANLQTLSWMDVTTLSKAMLKLGKVYNMIGYPDKPRNYTFPIRADSYAENVMAATAE